MDWLSSLPDAFTPVNIGAMLLGSFIGLLLGSLPGLGPAFTLSVFVPLTFGFPTAPSLIFLVAMYTAAVYGGAITAILVNVPGHPGNVATVFDGQPMMRQGRAREAIVGVGVAGAVGGLLSVIFLVLVSPVVADLVVQVSPAGYFMLAVCGLAFVATTAKGNLLQGMLLAAVGLMLATVGQDPVTGGFRFTVDNTYLKSHGIDFAVVVVGMFAIGSAFLMLEQNRTGAAGATTSNSSTTGDGLRAAARHPVPIVRSGLIGAVMGVFPGLGLALSNIVAYFTEAKINPRRAWGKGEVVGVMAPEAADNGTLVSELIPTFTLGLPGHITSALMLTAITVHGLQPGPTFFQNNPIVGEFFTMMFLSQVVFCLIGIGISGLLAKVARTPQSLLGPIILVGGFVGAYAANREVWDLLVALIFGIVGYIILRLKLPLAPLILGMILGPLVEGNFRRAVTIQSATGHFFLLQPLPMALAVLTVGALVIPTVVRMVRRPRREGGFRRLGPDAR